MVTGGIWISTRWFKELNWRICDWPILFNTHLFQGYSTENQEGRAYIYDWQVTKQIFARRNIYFFPPDPHELFRPELGQPFHRWTVGRDFCTGNSKTNQGSMSPFKFDSDIVKYFSFIQKLCPPWRWKSACSRRLSWLWTAWPIGSEHCGGEHGVRFWLVETKLQVFDLTTMSWSETGSLPEGMDGNALLAIERGPWAGQVPHNGFCE